MRPQSIFPEQSKFDQFHGFRTPEQTLLCQKGFLAEVSLFGGENGPGTGNVLFPLRDFFIGFPCWASGASFRSKTFPLRGFWARRVFSAKGPPVLFPLPWPGSALCHAETLVPHIVLQWISMCGSMGLPPRACTKHIIFYSVIGFMFGGGLVQPRGSFEI